MKNVIIMLAAAVVLFGCKSEHKSEHIESRPPQRPASLMIENRGAGPRLSYAAQRLQEGLNSFGAARIILSSSTSDGLQDDRTTEGFRLYRDAEGTYHIEGFGDSGALYGAMELIDRVKQNGDWPNPLDVTDAPAFRLRGPCIGMQLTSILPGHDTYEYPYTPQNFPFFYDKEQWIEFLDFLADNRMNTLYLL